LGQFEDHIKQSKSNLQFLSLVDQNIDNYWDWKVTVCFYTAVHLINAHIVKRSKANYLSHNKVDEFINPFSQFSPSKLDNPTYLAYQKLSNLSRRSRYLVHEDINKKTPTDIVDAQATYSKHYSRAIKYLEIIIDYVCAEHKQSISATNIKCIDLNNTKLKYFNIRS
jgi:hypothetical protein